MSFKTFRYMQYSRFALYQQSEAGMYWIALGYQSKKLQSFGRNSNFNKNHSTMATCYFELHTERPQADVSQQSTRCIIQEIMA